MGIFSLAVSPDSRFVTVGTGVSMGLSVFELQYRSSRGFAWARFIMLAFSSQFLNPSLPPPLPLVLQQLTRLRRHCLAQGNFREERK
jgi:hypothetical protein